MRFQIKTGFYQILIRNMKAYVPKKTIYNGLLQNIHYIKRHKITSIFSQLFHNLFTSFAVFIPNLAFWLKGTTFIILKLLSEHIFTLKHYGEATEDDLGEVGSDL